jgi:hypothetical protein
VRSEPDGAADGQLTKLTSAPPGAAAATSVTAEPSARRVAEPATPARTAAAIGTPPVSSVVLQLPVSHATAAASRPTTARRTPFDGAALTTVRVRNRRLPGAPVKRTAELCRLSHPWVPVRKARPAGS